MLDFINIDVQKFILFPFIAIIITFIFNIFYFKKEYIKKEWLSAMDSSNILNILPKKIILLSVLMFFIMQITFVYSYIVYSKIQELDEDILTVNDKNLYIWLTFVSIFLMWLIFNRFLHYLNKNWIDNIQKYSTFAILWLSISEIPAVIWLVTIFQKMAW